MGKSKKFVEDEEDIDESKKPNFDRHKEVLRQKRQEKHPVPYDVRTNPDGD